MNIVICGPSFVGKKKFRASLCQSNSFWEGAFCCLRPLDRASFVTRSENTALAWKKHGRYRYGITRRDPDSSAIAVYVADVDNINVALGLLEGSSLVVRLIPWTLDVLKMFMRRRGCSLEALKLNSELAEREMVVLENIKSDLDIWVAERGIFYVRDGQPCEKLCLGRGLKQLPGDPRRLADELCKMLNEISAANCITRA